MPHPGSETLQHLHKNYRNPDLTKRDIMQALLLYKGLVPKWDSFVFNNGEKKELLCLDGTIPVSYKGTTYNIPVCIWLIETHPYNSPMCFVKPTAEMQIKVSHHVDQTGKIYLPYLHDWKHNSSDLLGLIQVMIVVFGDHPPVYSKARSHSNDHSHSHSNYASSHGAPGYAPVNVGTQQQPLPPFPYPSYPPQNLPQYPQTSMAMPMPMPSVQPPGNYKYPGAPGSNYAPSSRGYPPPPPVQYPSYPPTTAVYPGSSPYANYPQPPAPAMGQQQQQQSTAPMTTNTISEEHIKASVLSAVEDKMKRRLRDVFSQAQAEMEVLKRTRDDLSQGKTKLEEIINKLEAEQLELDKNILVLREKNEAMATVISKMENQETIDVDEAVVTTTPLYKQLLNLFAEENATEDAIYYLGEGVRRGVIDLDLFLKHVRELSRKQFMLRALMQKCREKANLPC